jgi:hypothetical protein
MDACSNVVAEFLLNADAPIIFAGAGVSAHAGLPVWDSYLMELAEFSRQYDPMTRHMMADLIKEKDYPTAAAYYYLCKKIPEAEKYQMLVKSLKHYDAKKVEVLARLPVTAFVTTNYDRVLNDAYALAHNRSPVEVNLDDATMRSAPFQTDFFVARMHGRCEVPESMVLANEHYSRLLTNRFYIDLLTHIFTRRQILFVGFSFYDPAIKMVLQLVRENVGRVHNGRHLALLSEDADAELVSQLESFTIRKIVVPSASGHANLWACLTHAAEECAQREKTSAESLVTPLEPFSAAKQYLATCYTRTKLGERIRPLRKAVVEGIVAHAIRTRSNVNLRVSVTELNLYVHNELSLPLSEVEQLVREAIAALSADGLCIASNDGDDQVFQWRSTDETDTYDAAISRLVQGAINRYIVREQGIDSEVNRKCVGQFFHRLVLQRGWDLGAAFAGNRSPQQVEVKPIMELVPEFRLLDNKHNLLGLARACEDLLRHPNSEEASILAELGRLSFAVELVVQAPHDALFHSQTLPEKIYLDANVLMPAVTVGHPFHNVYKSSIDRLLEAASTALLDVRVVAYYGFLNEIVNHRRLATEEMRNLRGPVVEELRRQALLFGTANMNVFVGSYINLLASDSDLSFQQFLSKYAPYETESDLRKWLLKRNINVVDEREMTKGTTALGDILHGLEVAYANELEFKQKTSTLIRHDAVQLAALHADRSNGIRSVFVSADRRLRDTVAKGKFPGLASSMMSHVGLAQLIDLLIGSKVQSRALSSLIWSPKISSVTEQTRNYLIDVALSQYDEAVAMQMGDVVEHVTAAVTEEARRQGIKQSADRPEDTRKLRDVIEGFEDRFFEGMRDIIEKRRRQ